MIYDSTAEDESDLSPTPCEWENASGAETEDEDEESEAEFPPGERVSLRDSAFSDLLDACDEKINLALRVAVQAKQEFTFTAKVTFVRRGEAFSVKHETGYQFEPIKCKDKGELYEDIPIVLDKDGNPIIPHDREHQMSFSDLPPANEPEMEVAADGSGVVEELQSLDDVECADRPNCDKITCPFNLTEIGSLASVCGFVPQEGAAELDADLKGSICTAIENGCTRPEVQDAYNTLKFEQLDETAQKTSPCAETDCPFYDTENKGNCCFDATADGYGLPAYADIDEVLEAVEDFGCQRSDVIDEYNDFNE